MAKKKLKPAKTKTLQMAIGADLIGSRTSISAGRGTEIITTPNAHVAISKSSGRAILIPFANAKASEFATIEDAFTFIESCGISLDDGEE
jgi:hypothetical protein